jgi:hypothetical protein
MTLRKEIQSRVDQRLADGICLMCGDKIEPGAHKTRAVHRSCYQTLRDKIQSLPDNVRKEIEEEAVSEGLILRPREPVKPIDKVIAKVLKKHKINPDLIAGAEKAMQEMDEEITTSKKG